MLLRLVELGAIRAALEVLSIQYSSNLDLNMYHTCILTTELFS